MLSKVVAWGPDRTTALARLDRALAETVVLGFQTNINFLRALLGHPDVRSGNLDTGLVERELPALVAAPPATRAYIAVALNRLDSAFVQGDRRRPLGPCPTAGVSAELPLPFRGASPMPRGSHTGCRSRERPAVPPWW